MKKILTLFVCCFILIQSFGQTQRKISTYLFTNYNKTLRDYTIENNPWGVGLGLQAFFNNKTRFKPTIELTYDIYLEDDDVFLANPDGNFPKNDNGVNGMINLFVGSSYSPTHNLYLSLLAGPSFISERPLFGVKPSVGFYFPKNQRWTLKVSYINIFNRAKIINEDFSSLSVAVGLKLF